MGCGPIELSTGPSSENPPAELLLEQYASTLLQQHRIPDNINPPFVHREKSEKRGKRSWWVKGHFRGTDAKEYAYQLPSRSKAESFVLVVLLSDGNEYEPRILHRVDAPLENSTIERRSATTRLHRTDDRTRLTEGKPRGKITNAYDEILLRIHGASVIRFSWDPTTKQFKKNWISD